jgi:DNA recombination protein RmuC
MEIVLGIFVGIILIAAGWFTGWFIAKFKFQGEKGLSLDEVDKRYVARELYTKIESDLQVVKTENEQKEQTIVNLNKEVSRKEESLKGLNEKLDTQKQEIENLQNKLTVEFENIASRILQERSDQFLKTSKDNISNLLNPLDVKISDFRTRIDAIYKDETVERTSLKTEIKQLVELNKQLSEDANNLASALKGENKTQGDLGEIRLEMILERGGLIKDVHYEMQKVFTTEDGGKLRPDCIINLPDNKHLVIDSKVSLTAFKNYFSAKTDEEKKVFAAEHLNSVIGHIKDLSKKSYQNLYQISAPDYVFMFIPYESALALAQQENMEISHLALEKNIVLVTGPILLATMRIVASIWKQEDQKKNVIEIAKQGGALYDKFVSFVEDLKRIGLTLEQTKSSYDDAMNKLVTSTKKGDTLVGRADRLRKLGAQATKVLPQDILDQVEINEQEVLTNVSENKNESDATVDERL